MTLSILAIGFILAFAAGVFSCRPWPSLARKLVVVPTAADACDCDDRPTLVDHRPVIIAENHPGFGETPPGISNFPQRRADNLVTKPMRPVDLDPLLAVFRSRQDTTRVRRPSVAELAAGRKDGGNE